MYYTDYHMHTQLSADSKATLAGYATLASSRGIGEICLTDHWNLVDQQANLLPNTFDWDKMAQLILQERDRYFGQLDIRMGVEVGNGILDPQAVEQVISHPGVDFVIGSVHNVSLEQGAMGIFTRAHGCQSQEDCEVIMEDYMNTLMETAQSDGYDVIGHIVYPMRYFPKQFEITLNPYMEQLEEILKVVIQKGKGIELNTCKGTSIGEWLPILRLYRQLGGEIITTGSDAHGDQDLGLGLKEAVDLLRVCGYRWTSLYRNRTPLFMGI